MQNKTLTKAEEDIIDKKIALIQIYEDAVETAKQIQQEKANKEMNKEAQAHLSKLTSVYYKGKQLSETSKSVVKKLLTSIPDESLMLVYNYIAENDLFKATSHEIIAECIKRHLIEANNAADFSNDDMDWDAEDDDYPSDEECEKAVEKHYFDLNEIEEYFEKAKAAFNEYHQARLKTNYEETPEVLELKQKFEDASLDYEVICESELVPTQAIYDAEEIQAHMTSSTKYIYNILKSKVYKQDEYCKRASTILYNHVNGIRSINAVSGPSGCGKTYLWEQVRDNIYPNVIILDGKGITQNGFKGMNLSQVLAQIPFEDGIVVFDEFDKMITPAYESNGANVTHNLQGEFLKVLDDGYQFEAKDKDGTRLIKKRSTQKLTFIFCGSFADKAQEVADKDSGSKIGFTATEETKDMYFKPIELEDMIEFGLIKEIAGRIVDVISVNPLTVADYIEFMQSYSNSAVQQISEQYGCNIRLTDNKVKEIAEKAHESALGFRKAINLIKTEVNSYIFENDGIDNEIVIGTEN